MHRFGFVVPFLNKIPGSSCELLRMKRISHDFGTKLAKFASKRDFACVEAFKVYFARLFQDFLLIQVLLGWLV